MKIIYHKNFLKNFKKLSVNDKKAAKETIKLFSDNPFDKKLKNHPLKGRMRSKRAISIKNDLRIVFIEHNNYLVIIFLDLGKHNRVYE